MRRRVTLVTMLVFMICASGLAAGQAPGATAAGPADRINHVIVIYQENWSFDGLYGNFPGANGLANASPAAQQTDKNGQVYKTLPQPIDTGKKAVDGRSPADLPNQPFDVTKYVAANDKTGD